MATPSLQRRLGLGDAVAIGLGSMIGAGVFAAFGPAAQAAGGALLIGLVLAAIVAFGNATSSAQLAAVHPTSGGTYAYGRAELGPWWGFLAGWSFVVGKLASCAAMALTVAAYAAPPGWERPIAIAAVAALVTANAFGVTRTAQITRVLVVIVLVILAIAVAAGLAAPDAAQGPFDPGTQPPNGWYGILQSGGILFFAFAGYARIATMGEEVRDPRRTIPRAIVIALSIAVVVYATVAVTVLSALGAEGTAASSDAVAAAAGAGWPWAAPVVRVGAVIASLGALLALIAGIGRTAFAMAREGDLPRALSAVHPRWHVPRRADIAVGVIVIAVVAVADLRGVIGFSSFGVLLYYLVANIAALRQRGDARRYPRLLQIVGAVGCVVLGLALPWQSVVGGAGVVAAGILYRVVRLRLTRAT